MSKRSRKTLEIPSDEWFDWDLPLKQAEWKISQDEEKFGINYLGKFVLVPLESSFVEESEEYTEFYVHPIVKVSGKTTILKHRFDYEINGNNNLIIYL